MVLYTFDRPGPEQPDIGDVLAPPTKHDVIECGENNDVWINARRSTCAVELVSKVDGSIKKKVTVDEHFEKIAPSYGIGPRQIGAIRAALLGITPRQGPPGM